MLEKFEFDLSRQVSPRDMYFVVKGIRSRSLSIVDYYQVKQLVSKGMRESQVVAAYLSYDEARSVRKLMIAAEEEHS